MKQKHEGKDLQGLVDLGREQGYLTFDQVNDFLPQDVTSPTDLRSALESFEDMDIKVLEDVPVDGADGEVETEAKEEPEEPAEAAPVVADSLSDSSDPVRLYLKEMGNFQLLSREQEVEIAKRIEAGENEVEEEVLGSPVTLDFVMGIAERVEAGEADLRDIFEETEEPSDPEEERGPEANEKQLKKLFTAAAKLKSLHSRIEKLEGELKDRHKPAPKSKVVKSVGA
jgi:RNA polymerase primary sigma factor